MSTKMRNFSQIKNRLNYPIRDFCKKVISNGAGKTDFDVDPTRFALVSPGVNAGILLHILRARIHFYIINKKNLLCKRFRLFDT